MFYYVGTEMLKLHIKIVIKQHFETFQIQTIKYDCVKFPNLT